LRRLQDEAFIAHSQNKTGGTADIAEHRLSPFVVGAGNANTGGDILMINRFMISVAAAALIAGTGFANAQGTGMNREAPSAGSSAQQSAPAPDRAGSSAAPANRDATEPTGPSSGTKATQAEPKSPGAAKNQRADDKGNMQGQKPNSMSTQNDKAKNGNDKSGTDMKAEGREDRNGNMNAESKGGDNRSQTTGQAGAGAKLSGDQRTRITTVIRNQHVAPATNVNFAISVGTRVPREMAFHPLPTEVVTIYPEWRGYEFILVNGQIVVIDPQTFEIVAVIEA
jgi:Protein of unknown function (DUF1236)